MHTHCNSFSGWAILHVSLIEYIVWLLYDVPVSTVYPTCVHPWMNHLMWMQLTSSLYSSRTTLIACTASPNHLKIRKVTLIIMSNWSFLPEIYDTNRIKVGHMCVHILCLPQGRHQDATMVIRGAWVKTIFCLAVPPSCPLCCQKLIIWCSLFIDWLECILL